MEFQSVISKRKMIRSFENKQIPKKILAKILANTFSGPSAGFSQGVEVLVLTNPDKKEKFYSQWGTKEERRKGYTKWPKLENASVIIIICCHKNAYLNRYAEADKGWTDKDEGRWSVPYWYVEAGMAALLGLLTVVDERLGAVFTGCRDLNYIRREFEIPDEYTPIGAILIGYPSDVDPPSPSLKRGRRNLKDVIHYESW